MSEANTGPSSAADLTDSLLAVFTLLLVLVGGWQGVQLKRTVDHMEGTSEIELRAYVGITNVEMHCPSADFPEGTILVPQERETFKPDCVIFTAINGGQTPATAYTMHCNNYWTPYGFGLPPGFNYPDYDSETAIDESTGLAHRPLASESTIMPGKENRSNGFINVDLVRRARNKEVSLYIYGHADYADVFGNKRATEFCYMYVPNLTGEGENFFTYHEHNKTT
jgi:hypothetical protein